MTKSPLHDRTCEVAKKLTKLMHSLRFYFASGDF